MRGATRNREEAGDGEPRYSSRSPTPSAELRELALLGQQRSPGSRVASRNHRRRDHSDARLSAAYLAGGCWPGFAFVRRQAHFWAMSDTLSPSIQAALVSRELVAERTMSFRFERPAGWSYRAGQSIDMTLLDPPETDDEGNIRAFSISSAPRENEIAITSRLRDTAFKRVLQRVALGTQVKIEGPFGDFRLHHAARPAVLLAGGIGVTPFRSILVETIGGGSLPYRVVLFHANRRPQDAAFAGEFRALATADPNLTYVQTMTGLAGAPQAWDGEQGHIDADMLKRHLSDVTDPIYYIAGPAGMVQQLRSMLVAAAVDEDDIRTEEFSGY
jgi:ferredoxin-NADP reductase